MDRKNILIISMHFNRVPGFVEMVMLMEMLAGIARRRIVEVRAMLLPSSVGNVHILVGSTTTVVRKGLERETVVSYFDVLHSKFESK